MPIPETSAVPARYSVAEVAEKTGISARVISDLARRGLVPHFTIGRRRTFSAEQIAALVAHFTVTPGAPQARGQGLQKTKAGRSARQLARAARTISRAA